MNKIIAFMIGAGVGSLVTWKIIEQKYKKIADEEIESVINRFKNRDVLKPLIDYDEKKTNDEHIEYSDKVDELGYSVKKEEEEIIKPTTREIFVTADEYEEVVEPYVISPEEYGEVYDYNTKNLTYYADCILADEEGVIVGDPENIIGDALSHFGEYEDDSVHVRNENLGCDYEILKHEKTFDDIYNRGMIDDDII